MAWGGRRHYQTKMGNVMSKCALKHSHRSKLEASICQMIQLRQKEGALELLRTEVNLEITEAKIKYIADFEVRDLKTNEVFYIEAKGFESARWPIIKKLWKHYGPAKLEVWKGTYQRYFLDETILPDLTIDEDLDLDHVFSAPPDLL